LYYQQALSEAGVDKPIKIKFEPINRVVFDIETEPFSEEFRDAASNKDRIAYAPRMRVACAYEESRNRYTYYTDKQAAKLIELLRKADQIISFNGLGFDILVLERHYGLDGPVPLNGIHTDLCQEVSIHERRMSLDRLAQINFGERKHTKGREMYKLDLEELKIACKSDVEHTYKLWKLYDEGELRYFKEGEGAVSIDPYSRYDKKPAEGVLSRLIKSFFK
jgi:hypothetical protein